jgi:glutathione S-transferase
MRLVGMLDSPFVRRVAISLQLLELPFEHEPVSVFRTFDRFRSINPVVKAPTLVCDDGVVLMDSTLILDYAEALAAPRTLMPGPLPARRHALRLIGLALAGCEKTAQVVYEHTQRPADKRHAPWLERVESQLVAAYAALEAEVALEPPAMTLDAIDQSGITVAVAWYFSRHTLPGLFDATRFPALTGLSEAAETLPPLRAAPYGDGTVGGRFPP